MEWTKEKVMEKTEGMACYQAPVFGADGEQIERYRAIRTNKGDEPLAILGKTYKLYNHKTAVRNLFEELDEQAVNYEVRDFKDNGGRRISLTVGFPEMAFDVDGSEIEPSATVVNSVDGTLRFQKLFGYFRLVCTNGMIVGEKVFSVSRKHYENTFEVKRLDFDKIAEHRDGFQALLEKSQRRRVTKAMRESLIKSGFPNRVIENWQNLFERYSGLHDEVITGETVWALQAVLTNWLSNVVMRTDIDRARKLSLALYRSIRARNADWF